MLQAEACLLMLSLVARADGEVTAVERERVLAAARASSATASLLIECTRILDATIPCDENGLLQRIASLVDGSVLLEVARDGYLLAFADGHVAEAEVRVIDRLFERFGLSPQDRAMLHSWGRTAGNCKHSEKKTKKTEKRTEHKASEHKASNRSYALSRTETSRVDVWVTLFLGVVFEWF